MTEATESRFKALSKTPSHPEIEHEMLEVWDREQTFRRVRERNAGAEPWSFVDGPITANNPMGVHHCWGRSLKDLFQRYKAMRGYDLRYQNGFDCQGLHVEVGVEQSLGLNSKREIEEYGLAEFAARCRERVAKYAAMITDQSRRLGMWMDWDDSYYTFSDRNIEYIWRFLAKVHENGWLYLGHRATQWCPRCGTSISEHELVGPDAYADIEHSSLVVTFPLEGRDGESLTIWTTTPWTLPANVAAAVAPDAEYVLADGRWMAAERAGDRPVTARTRGRDMAGWRYRTPFGSLPAQDGVEHRVVCWDEVSLEEGTGIVHIAPGCGAEDFALGREEGLAVLSPLDEAGRFVDGYGPFTGLIVDDAAQLALSELDAMGRIVSSTRITHRYPVCWRCATPLVVRVADDWFISADEIRQRMIEANDTVEWTPEFYSKRMTDWLRNMGDWNISRRRYFGLPLPIYPCRDCHKVTVVASVEELKARAVSGLDQLQELHRPWIDEVRIRCDCGSEVARIPEVGDAWLDAGIVPFATLGWENPETIPNGYANGASAGLSGADLPDHAYWEKWFPADWVSEMREQIRLWFYSQLFMSVTLTGGAPYKRVLTYEKIRDETGREMHKSWGNAIEANDAMERMGADVMRFMYAEHVPHHDLNFGFARGEDLKRRLLTFWNSVKFLVDYGNIEGFEPRLDDLDTGPPVEDLQPLDRWLVARTRRAVADAEDAFDRFWTPDATKAWEEFVDDVSRWYIRLSRRRFYEGDRAAFGALWFALASALRIAAPVMPFLSDYVWRAIVAGSVPGAPESVFLAGWPERQAPTEADDQLIGEMAAVRQVVDLGRKARAKGGVKLRQPLPRLVVDGPDGVQKHAELIAQELRVRTVEFGNVEAEHVVVKPNLVVLGPRIGKDLPKVRAALLAGEYDTLPDGGYRVGDHVIGEDEVLVERSEKQGWAISSDERFVVAVDLSLDDDLLREGELLDLVHAVNNLRKDSGFQITDRIRLTIPKAKSGLLEHEEFIKKETLATSVEAGDDLAVELAPGS